MENTALVEETVFTRYQVFVIAILAILQFTIVLDFMVLSPLGAILMPKLQINTTQFGWVVSAYAFSAGASGFLAAGFADRYDRKKLLIFFYFGFLLGTLFCAIATTYVLLLAARIVTGIFGGVIGSIIFAIVSDLYKLDVRGRVMGYVQMAFAASQVLGLPLGLFLANKWGWHSPFWLIVFFGLLVGFVIVWYMRPISGHLKLKSEHNAFVHLAKTISETVYIRAFLGTVLLATGGFMLMPFGSAFATQNLGLDIAQLPIMYGVTGISSIISGPLIGRYSDKIGVYNVFIFGSVVTIATLAIYCNLGISSLWFVIILNMCMFVGINSRIISSSTLMTAVPDAADRGAFMSINSSIQQVSGGVAAAVAGTIVVQAPDGKLLGYDTLGYVVIVSIVVSVMLMHWIAQYVKNKSRATVHGMKM
jgi:predicted MFS family arabinose efflux permease